MGRLRVLPNGKLYVRNGRLSVANCCCGAIEYIDCGACTGTVPSTLLIEVDASGAVENPFRYPDPGAPGCGCVGCHLIGGSYAMSTTAPEYPYECRWLGSRDAPGFEAVCNCAEGPGGLSDTAITFYITNYGFSDHYAIVNFDFADTVTYTWTKYLGSTSPACSTLFPMTFGTAESSQQYEFDLFGSFLGQPCDMRSLEITVDLP